MNFIEKLDMLKARTGDNTLSLAKKAGIPPTTLYGLYTKGYEKMQLSTLQALCDYFGVSLDYLAKDTPGSGEKYTSEAIRIASEFDTLDSYGQKAVRAILDVELSRASDAATAADAPAPVVSVRRYCEAAAAGVPLYVEGGYEYVDYPREVVPEATDYAVGISGHSMEPDYPDGCTVFVQRVNRVHDGDVVIAWLEGEGTVCKRVVAPFGHVDILESINRAYPNYSGAQLNGMRIYGKVIGYTI